MTKTHEADWYFIIPATLIWMVGLIVIGLDFSQQLKTGYHFTLTNFTGLICMVTGVSIRLAARKALHGQFSYALRVLEKHELVKDGIYQHIRHPAYAGDLLFHFGLPLLFSSLAGLLVMLLLIPCFIYRMRLEERILSERFGETYREYMRHSKRLIPFIY